MDADDELDIHDLDEDGGDEVLAPDESLITEEETATVPQEEEVVKELEEIPEAEEPPAKHKVYPVDPDKLAAPLRPDELWDEDGTI